MSHIIAADQLSNRRLSLRIKCPLCATVNTVIVFEKDLNDYHNGTHAQDAFPDLNNDERELIMTGICTPCWDDLLEED